MRWNCTTCLSWPVLDRPSTNLTLRVKSWTGSSSTPSGCTKKAFKVASPLGLMCRIEAMEECIARKSHELPARQPSATPTTDAPPFPLSQLVMITRAGEAPLPESTDNGVSEVCYITELVPSSPAKEPQRRRTRLQSRRAAWAPSNPNVF